VDVLALVHEDHVPPGTFAGVVTEQGHRLDVRSFALANPPGDAGGYGAAIVFGGSMQVDQDGAHPWLAGERAYVRELVDRGVPTLAVCLGAQLLAQVAGAEVGPAAVPEVGWYPVELTADGRDDPVLGPAGARFAAYQGHSYGFGAPPGAVALARGPGDQLQAYRLGDAAWGVQFHPEVTWPIVDRWIAEHARDGEVDDEQALRAETRASLPGWMDFGRALCARFLDAARQPSLRSRDRLRP
jgi:GMP synthase (glutamine-hydrolysing)